MSGKIPSFPGFTALSDQVFVREPDVQDGPASPDHPSVVVIYGWGDGIPKHVAKYTDGFRALFPHARQVAVLSPISKAMFSDLEARSEAMLPVVKTLFPSGPPVESKAAESSILLHAMSNTGAINYASTINKYLQLYNQPMPHRLLVLDSTPGSTDLTVDNLKRWSRAMALGTAGWFPWPFLITQCIWASALFVNRCFEIVVGREHAGAWSRKATNEEAYMTKESRRLYMYSKEDDLIGWEDIEAHVGETRQLGWDADVEVFQGSTHVGHMRQHPEQYWGSIKASWQRAVESQGKMMNPMG